MGVPKFVNHLFSLHLTTNKVKVVTKPNFVYDLRRKTSESAQNPQVFLLELLSAYLESLQCYSDSLANEKGLLP